MSAPPPGPDGTLDMPRIEPAATRRLAEPARRFLRPLVGLDPDTVHIHQSPTATAALAAAGAEAATVGATVVLPAEAEERSPRGLALVAHELTHAARSRHPGFLPPVVRAADPSRVITELPYSVAPTEPRFVGAEEEPLARTVESQVRLAAANEQRAEGPVALATADVGAREWNGLPAPWEPLPALPDPPAGTVTVAPSIPVPDQVVHFAGADRDTAAPAETAAATAAAAGAGSAAPAGPAPAAAPKPDLDALARQVYDVLKRRIAAERRREGSWGSA